MLVSCCVPAGESSAADTEGVVGHSVGLLARRGSAHQISFSVAGSLTTRLSRGQRPVLAPAGSNVGQGQRSSHSLRYLSPLMFKYKRKNLG
jgi:hypothetical protein